MTAERKSEECSTCGGSGAYKNAKCKKCGGEGFILWQKVESKEDKKIKDCKHCFYGNLYGKCKGICPEWDICSQCENKHLSETSCSDICNGCLWEP